jgi:hypothetical protein
MQAEMGQAIERKRKESEMFIQTSERNIQMICFDFF